MSDKKEKVDKIEEEIKDNIDNEKKLLSEIEELKKQLNISQEKIVSYEKHLESINTDYALKIKEKSEQANKIIQEKIAELDSKHKEVIEHTKKYGIASAATQLIEIIDQFQKAINFTSEDPKVNNFLAGFKMFNSMFNNLLDDMNIKVKKINVGDEFDPVYMDAFDTTEDENIKNNAVSFVASNAYLLHDRVIKLGVVKVNKNEK
jgi:molecular chaperone GrpE